MRLGSVVALVFLFAALYGVPAHASCWNTCPDAPCRTVAPSPGIDVIFDCLKATDPAERCDSVTRCVEDSNPDGSEPSDGPPPTPGWTAEQWAGYLGFQIWVPPWIWPGFWPVDYDTVTVYWWRGPMLLMDGADPDPRCYCENPLDECRCEACQESCQDGGGWVNITWSGTVDLTVVGTYTLTATLSNPGPVMPDDYTPCEYDDEGNPIEWYPQWAADPDVQIVFTLNVVSRECGAACKCEGGTVCCGDTPDNQQCYDPQLQCCEDNVVKNKNCGSACCDPGETCCVSTCCEANHECCDGVCCEEGQCCHEDPETGEKSCADKCGTVCECPEGQCCQDGECVTACATNPCSTGECKDGHCESTCDKESCEKCDASGTCVSSCTEGQCCQGGRCVDECDTSQCYEPGCDASGQCKSLCDKESCEKCEGGVCVSSCQAGQCCQGGRCVDECETSECYEPGCDARGQCKFLCDKDNCEKCEGGSCVSSCEAGQCCQGGRCVDECETSECYEPGCDANGRCTNRCKPKLCQECDHAGSCVSSCPPEKCCEDGRCVDACDPVCYYPACDNGHCVPRCDPNACLKCDKATGACVTTCNERNCETCDGEGGCVPRCDPQLCETCDGEGQCEVCGGDKCSVCGVSKEGLPVCKPKCDDEDVCTKDDCDPDTGDCCHLKVLIENVEWPNDFLAIPDVGIYADTWHTTQQQASTDVKITYTCDNGDGECTGECEEATVELLYTGTERQTDGSTANLEDEVLWSGTLPALSAGECDTITATIDLIRQGLQTSTYRFAIRKKDPPESEEYRDCDAKPITANPLIASLGFFPRAHQRAPDHSLPGPYPVCPYTHQQPDLDGSNPLHVWYGLLMTYNLPASLSSLNVTVSGTNLNKRLRLMPEATGKSTYAPRCIKWECYDGRVDEPSSDPVCVFPTTCQYAPEYVVREGEYAYEAEATAVGTLRQYHRICDLRVYVQYDLENIKQ